MYLAGKLLQSTATDYFTDIVVYRDYNVFAEKPLAAA